VALKSELNTTRLMFNQLKCLINRNSAAILTALPKNQLVIGLRHYNACWVLWQQPIEQLRYPGQWTITHGYNPSKTKTTTLSEKNLPENNLLLSQTIGQQQSNIHL